jgi:hypothetical protein
MKTSVKISLHESISIEPSGQNLKLTFTTPVFSFDRILSVDQASVICFAIEQVLDVLAVRIDSNPLKG